MTFDFVLFNYFKRSTFPEVEAPRSANPGPLHGRPDFRHLVDPHLDQGWVVDWDSAEDGWTFELKGAILYISHDGHTPVKVVVTSTILSQKRVDLMTQRLCEFIGTSTEYIKSLQDVAVLLVRIVKYAVRCVKSSQEKHKCTESLLYQKGWNAKKMKSWDSRWDNARGVDLSTIDDTAMHLLGKSLQDICSEVPDGWRILHVESVFRDDLVERFFQKKAQMYQSMLELDYALLRKSVDLSVIPAGSTNDTREGLAAALSKPSVAFHGTYSRFIHTIVRYGFVKVGGMIGDAGVLKRMGNGGGKGIYSTPVIKSAISYSRPWEKRGPDPDDDVVVGREVIVAAVLMGRSGLVELGVAQGQEKPYHEFTNSNMYLSDREWVVFDEAQIIPCYVIRLDNPEESAKRNPPKDRLNWNPVDAQQHKASSTETSGDCESQQSFAEPGPEVSQEYWLDHYQKYRLTDTPAQLSIDKPGQLSQSDPTTRLTDEEVHELYQRFVSGLLDFYKAHKGELEAGGSS